MLRRIVEVSEQPTRISVQHNQILLRTPADKCEDPYARNIVWSKRSEVPPSRRIPASDLALLLLDQRRSLLDASAAVTITQAGGCVVFCGEDHLPAGYLLPSEGHSQVHSRLQQQATMSAPFKKRAWAITIQSKLLAQATSLETRCDSSAAKLRRLATDIRSGDPSNVEAHGARIYWSAWLKPDTDAARAFRRKRAALGGKPPNSMLDYGYAVLRALVARSLISRGLSPCLGIHHRNRSNAFNLADDLMEPLRPIIDARVRFLYEAGHEQVTPAVKRELLPVLFTKVAIRHNDNSESGPLQVVIDRMADSFVQALEGGKAADAESITFPEIT